MKRSAGVLMGLLAWQSLCQPSGHTVTLGACDKLAAKSLCVMERLKWGLSWVLCGSGREGQERCQVRAGIQPAQ